MLDNVKVYDQKSWMMPIRKRPEMYLGALGKPEAKVHLLREFLCCAADAAVTGCCTEVTVALSDDDSVLIGDDGPGFSGIQNPKWGKSELELVMTSLFACRELRNHDAAQGFCQAGIAVANALSAYCHVSSAHAGMLWDIHYTQGVPGALVPLKRVPGKGLWFHFRPDPLWFSGPWDRTGIEAVLEEGRKLRAGVRWELVG